MWIPTLDTIVLALIVVFAALSVVGFAVLARQARREGRR